MSPHQIIAVAVRLFVVWLAVGAVFGLPQMYVEVTKEMQSDALVLVFGFAGVALVLALLVALWRFPLTVARKLLSSPAPEPSSSASSDLWLAMGCALMGLWLLVVSLPEFARDLTIYREGFMTGDPNLKVRMAYHLPAVAIGLWLIFGARGFRKLFWWAQSAGRSHPPNDTQSLPPD